MTRRWTFGAVGLVSARWNLATLAEKTAGGLWVWREFAEH